MALQLVPELRRAGADEQAVGVGVGVHVEGCFSSNLAACARQRQARNEFGLRRGRTGIEPEVRQQPASRARGSWQSGPERRARFRHRVSRAASIDLAEPRGRHAKATCNRHWIHCTSLSSCSQSHRDVEATNVDSARDFTNNKVVRYLCRLRIRASVADGVAPLLTAVPLAVGSAVRLRPEQPGPVGA